MTAAPRAGSEALNELVMSAERRALLKAIDALTAVASGGHMVNATYRKMARHVLNEIRALVPDAGGDGA